MSPDQRQQLGVRRVDRERHYNRVVTQLNSSDANVPESFSKPAVHKWQGSKKSEEPDSRRSFSFEYGDDRLNTVSDRGASDHGQDYASNAGADADVVPLLEGRQPAELPKVRGKGGFLKVASRIKAHCESVGNDVRKLKRKFVRRMKKGSRTPTSDTSSGSAELPPGVMRWMN
ncbi:hypothetical protein PVAG01_01858 [Phlyctema vagabunda]|uniref:Uncharacterized protein n=1 Tax=Phlyctema vagabunda TaxID=108571 RepID=A0ABR4PYL2_9HELO